MTAKLSPGALVRRKRFNLGDRRERSYQPDDPIWAIRCPAARPGWYHRSLVCCGWQHMRDREI
jgi:hypothetical protein